MHGPNDIITIHIQLASLTNQVGALNQQQPRPLEKKMSLEAIMKQLITTTKAFMAQTKSFMTENETKIENQEAFIKIKQNPYKILKFRWSKLLTYSLQEYKDRYQATPTKFQKSKYMQSP